MAYETCGLKDLDKRKGGRNETSKLVRLPPAHVFSRNISVHVGEIIISLHILPAPSKLSGVTGMKVCSKCTLSYITCTTDVACEQILLFTCMTKGNTIKYWPPFVS